MVLINTFCINHYSNRINKLKATKIKKIKEMTQKVTVHTTYAKTGYCSHA